MKHKLQAKDALLEELETAVHILCEGADEEGADAIKRAVTYAWASRQQISTLPNPLVVANHLKSLGGDEDTLVAALLSSMVKTEQLPLETIQAEFGSTVTKLVKNVRWLHDFAEPKEVVSSVDRVPEQAEKLRRMLLAMVEDVRAILIKLVYRARRLQKIAGEPYELRRYIAQETMALYAPLANRLGIGQLKWEMEDLAFRNLEPQAYKRIALGLEQRREERETYIHGFVETLKEKLVEADIIQFDVLGRAKHIYSIWRKMQRKQVALNDLFDVLAVRVLVDDVRDCYTVLGVIHSEWHNIPKEFDDYITNPKSNGYQSLHTAVIGPQGRAVEVQIRTRQMNDDAELGVAAHWRYKEGGGHDAHLQEGINALRQLLDRDCGEESLLESFDNELFPDRVFVFTPKGDVHDMPAGSTPLDFAYLVHTDVGHRCRGAKVNGKITPLSYTLCNGDQVEILTAKEARPSRDWLTRGSGYLRTSRARAKVRAWFNIRDHEQHLDDGKQIIERELKRLNTTVTAERLVSQMRFEKLSELQSAVGRSDITTAQITGAVYALEAPKRSRVRRTKKPLAKRHPDDISVRGVGSLLTQLASCCKPVPYDGIIGFITRGKGVTVHRVDCANMLNLPDDERERLIEVSWGEEYTGRYPVDIRVVAFDRPGLLRDVSAIMANEELNVTSVTTNSLAEDQTAIMNLTVEIEGVDQLEGMLSKLQQLPNVLTVERVAHQSHSNDH